MTPLDPRLHAFRPDLADVNLKGRVAAERFVTPQLAWIKSPVAPLFKRPAPNLSRETEGLYGEPVHVFEWGDTYCWVQILSDGYVGYIATEDLSFTLRTMPTHYVHTRGSHMYPLPDLKSPPLRPLPFMAQLCVVGDYTPNTEVLGHERSEARSVNHNNVYAELENGCYVPWVHLTSLQSGGLKDSSSSGPSDLSFVALAKEEARNRPEDPEIQKLDPGLRRDDVLNAAKSFLNTPYLWGGKSYAGIDCSGLVQLSFAAAGLKMPRDSDMQEQNACHPERSEGSPSNGALLQGDPSATPQDDNFIYCPADLIFWRGHVAIALDSKNLIHANAHHMAVTIEPIQQAIARIAVKGDELRGVGRII